MTVRGRVLASRLIQKIDKNIDYAEKIGVICSLALISPLHAIKLIENIDKENGTSSK